MKCYFSSYCREPKNLCCDFCSNTKCDIRCKDNHLKCNMFENEPIKRDPNRVDHIITKPNNNVNKELYYILNKKQKLKLYKKDSSYIVIKDTDNKDKNTQLALLTKTWAEKKKEELNKDSNRNYWSIELFKEGRENS